MPKGVYPRKRPRDPAAWRHLSASVPRTLLDRINAHVPSYRRSAWVRKVLAAELDRLEAEARERSTHV